MPILNTQIEPNVIVSKVTEPFDVQADATKSLGEIQGFLAQTNSKLYLIVDCTAISPAFSQIVVGMAETSHEDSPLRNANMEVVLVATGKMLEAMANWYQQDQYGNITIPVYKSVDEALNYVKAQAQY